MAPWWRRNGGCPFHCRCDSNNPDTDTDTQHEPHHHICSAGTCSCYGRDNHICGCSAMSCRRPGLTTPYNHVPIQKGYMSSAHEPGQIPPLLSAREPSDMMKFANVNAWMRRISLMLQKEEEMRAPGTTWYQDLLVTPKHLSGAHGSRNSTPEDDEDEDENDDTCVPQYGLSSSSRANGNGNGHHNMVDHNSQHDLLRGPMDPSKKLGKIWDQWNCNLHLRRISEISRGSAACRLVDQHVHRRLTHHMLRHIVEVGRALPNDMEKSLYLEELMPPPVAILPPDEQDASDSNMRWSLLANDTTASSSSGSSSGNNNHNVYIPKRLKDATYADLLHISTSRARNNPKRIAANATAAAEDRRALDPSDTVASSSKGNHTKHKNLPGKKKPRPTTNNKTSNHNIAAAALATSAFANMLVSSGTKVKESADVIDALESAEHQLQCDAVKRGFVGKFTIHDIRSQMILFLDEIMVGTDRSDRIRSAFTTITTLL